VQYRIWLTIIGICCLATAAQPGGARAQDAGGAPAPPAVTGGPNTDAFAGPIRNGDSIRVVVASEASLGGDFRVENDGTVQIPRLGALKVAGHMQSDAAKTIAKRIQDQKLLKRADVAVYITGRKVRSVVINGAVTTQGQQPIKDGTLLSEILEGANPVAGADLSRVAITHADGTSQTVDYRKFRNGVTNTTDVNPSLQEGDRIYVYSSVPTEGTIRVSGEVKDQSRLVLPLTSGMTVGQALQLVGGVTDYADRGNIYVSRAGQRLPVPYDDILRRTPGKDIVLQDKDEIDIPRLDKPRQITVAGAVRDPKSESLLSRLTLLEAVAGAGGPQDGAQQGKVELRRRDGNGQLATHVYDLTKDTDAATELIDGDYVFVPYPRQRPRTDPGTVIGILSGLAILFSTLRHH
jgi:protein involved in polysaccharide export with SLBB domain